MTRKARTVGASLPGSSGREIAYAESRARAMGYYAIARTVDVRPTPWGGMRAMNARKQARRRFRKRAYEWFVRRRFH